MDITKAMVLTLGHYRSSPDSYRNNNWSTSGNANPYTGERGTRTFGGT